VLSVLQLNLVESQTNSISCNVIKNHHWRVYIGDANIHVQTCYVNRNLSIEIEGFVISSEDSNVKALDFGQNKNIEFLPSSPYQAFPSLELYNAPNCSVKSVTFQNFMKLNKLRGLYLYENQIETIKSDTFKDLAALEELWMGKF
jgi:Leucine-rich repeat (LRR) protein